MTAVTPVGPVPRVDVTVCARPARNHPRSIEGDTA
jgi:hypothetical protein